MYTNNAVICVDGRNDIDPLHHQNPQNMNRYDTICSHDVEQLSLEIEKERVEYLEKTKQVEEQLRDLRSEMEELKVGDKATELDNIHEEQVRLGENKYSTLRKVIFYSKSG